MYNGEEIDALLRASFRSCSQTAFIKQEALEKAREIKVKADEEFAIEKVRAAWCFSLSLVTAALSTTASVSDAAG